MSNDIAWAAAGQFCMLTPTAIVWLGAALYCAFHYERAPLRFGALGALLAVVLVASIVLPFSQLILRSSTFVSVTSFGTLQLVSTLVGIASAAIVIVLPPVALVAIGLLTPAPKADTP